MRNQSRISCKSPPPARLTKNAETPSKKTETLSRYQFMNSIMIRRSPGSGSASECLHHPTRNEPIKFLRRGAPYPLKISTGLTRVARLDPMMAFRVE